MKASSKNGTGLICCLHKFTASNRSFLGFCRMVSAQNGDRPTGDKVLEESISFEKRTVNGAVAVHTITVSDKGKAADKKLDEHET